VKVQRGAYAGSDHELQLSKVKAKISRRHQTRPQHFRRYNTGKLTSAAANEDFFITIRNKFQILADIDTDSIESKWERVKTALQSTCEEKLGYKKRSYKSWLRDDTVTKIEERRSIKLKFDPARTRTQKTQAQAEYREIQKEVKKTAREDKRAFVGNMASKTQEPAERQDMKTLYDITKKLVGRKIDMGKPVKTNDGRTLTKPDQQHDRWIEHFSEILNSPKVQ